jgi:DNA-binding transcriptional MerR regulator
MKTRLLSMADVARESMVPRHRISYALEIGALPEPPRLGGRRCFRSKDLEAIRSYFGKDSKNERQ